MAAVFIPPSPQPLFEMSTRRAPLAQVPNGTNSPYRTATLAGGKRLRPQAGLAQDIPYGQPPPKKQQLEKEDVEPLTPTSKMQSNTTAESRVFTRKNPNARPTALERKLVAARESTRASRQEKDNADSIRQWQIFYRKAFPTFVFYFESIPDEARSKCSRQVVALGARVEKFFSKAVTHVVTTRSKIPDVDVPAEPQAGGSSTTERLQQGNGQLKTINPSLLEKNSDILGQTTLLSKRHPLDMAATRRLPSGLEVGKETSSNGDVLSKAKQMGMKVWQLEKLSRIISTMNDAEGAHGHNTRNSTALVGKYKDEVNLSQVLRNEKLNGPSDRDPSVSQKDLQPFKGPFIYIHDITEQTKPVMVRDYPKVANRSDGAWPQFRSTSLGKCPFIEEPVRRDVDREHERQRMLQKDKARALARTRSATANATKKMDPPERQSERKVERLAEESTSQQRQADDSMPEQKPLEPPKMLPMKLHSHKSSESLIAPSFARPSHACGQEPAASGIQPSNITSAIRSQMISSTAAGPGVKAGTSKEVHELKRKVLEKSNSGYTSGIPRSQSMTDIAGTLRAMRAPATRAAKSKAQEKLGFIHEEDTTQSESEARSRQRASRAAPQKKVPKKDPKPGYCENCRDKYDDFEEHTLSRRHRKFACTDDNWKDLDALLFQLERPLKAPTDDSD